MRIGIDIDDTIASSWKYMIPIYSKEFNISIDENSLPYYHPLKNIMSFEQFSERMRKYEQLNMDIPLKEHVQAILKKLKEEGHTIIFITARGSMYSNPYKITKDYLDKYSIPYDKIIVDSWDKASVCKNENIDLFIDDSYKHCQEVKDIGISVLMMETNYNKQYKEFRHVKDWKEIYEYIQNR